MDEIDTLKNALRAAYQLAWNIERETSDPFGKLRAQEIRRVTMAALQATNAEFQAGKLANTAPRTDGGHDGTHG